MTHEDLLGREPVELERAELVRFLRGARVLITGAGGSIGGELAKQVAELGPESLVLVDQAESTLVRIERELHSAHPESGVASVLADSGGADRMERILAETVPHLVVHAAAYKHVPMMERYPCEAITNNVLGTRTFGELCGRAGVEHFILVSTDKAVRPTSVMGASKRLAELVIQDLNCQYSTVFAAVRFGNVLGSAGSVIPIFRDQIERGGPVTVTDPEMRRYFMSIPEAAQLVLRAGSMAEGGEIFVLDMGEPVRIVELAEKMIRLSGYEPHVDIPITITGRRPGEKLYEELGSDAEGLTHTRHPKILIGQLEPYPHQRLRDGLDRLALYALRNESDAVRTFLAEFLPEAQLDAPELRQPAGTRD